LRFCLVAARLTLHSKRITILVHGTRGDVEPMIALGLELQRRGHCVRIAAPEAFTDLIAQHGLEAARLRCSMDRMLATKRLWKYTRFGFLSRWLYIHDIENDIGARAFEDAVAACKDAEAIVFHPLMPFGSDIAEAMQVPAFVAAFQPIAATAEFPLFSMTGLNLGATFNRLSYRLMRVPYAWYARRINRARRRLLGLKRRGTFADPLTIRGRPLPTLQAVSRAVVPPPKDWGAQAIVTGYWFLDAPDEWQPPAELCAFLAKDPKPIFIGFGSNPIGPVSKLLALVTEAMQRTGQRAVLCLSEEPPRALANISPLVHVTGPLPHRWIFRHVAAAVHHGGTNTVAASLRAGLPTLVCPLLIDQHWWAERVHAIGAGPAPLRYDDLTVDRLAERLKELTSNPAYAQAAQCTANEIAAENGVGKAADFLEAHC
jgi:sterol 3beta-glucosyltransferase